MKSKLFIINFFAILILINLVSAFSMQDIINFDPLKLLGFEESNFVKHFIIGFLAGLYLWIFYISIIRLYWKIKEYKDRSNPYNEIKGRWIELIAGGLWKVLIIAFSYAVFLEIPLLNRLIQIITLDRVIQEGWGYIFLKSLVLALELGFLPSIFEYYLRIRLEAKYQKGLENAIKKGN